MLKKSKRRKGAPTPTKKLEADLQCHVRLYDKYDRELRAYIEAEAHANERSIPQQLRFMLRQAAMHPQRVLMQERN